MSLFKNPLITGKYANPFVNQKELTKLLNKNALSAEDPQIKTQLLEAKLVYDPVIKRLVKSSKKNVLNVEKRKEIASVTSTKAFLSSYKKSATKQFEPLLDVLYKLVESYTKNPTMKLVVEFESGIIPGAKITKTFAHLNHLMNLITYVENGGDGGSGENGDGDGGGDTSIIFANGSGGNAMQSCRTSVGGGCNKHSDTNKTIDGKYYQFKLYNPQSRENNCFFKCVDHLLKIKTMPQQLRSKYGIKLNTKITPIQAVNIYKSLKKDNDKHLKVMLKDAESYDDTCNNILLYDSHYYCVESVTIIEKREKKTKHGVLFWDCETRPDFNDTVEMTANGVMTKVPKLKDIITAIYYRPNRATNFKKHVFTTNVNKSSVREFIDWLIIEKNSGRSYNCYAHNCSRFDLYFLLAQLNAIETQETTIKLRHMSIINLQLFTHNFKDTYCFLTKSLDQLCSDFKIDNGSGKQTSFVLHGNLLDNKQLCFYKPELGVQDFLALENKDTKFWKLYTDYCMYDCISLSLIWDQFDSAMTEMITSISSKLLLTCSLNSAITIGGLSKKIHEQTCKLYQSKNYRKMVAFTNATEKYEFMKMFKRGGISHCNKPGKHNEQVVGYDIKSQYPAAMKYMKIPIGESVLLKGDAPIGLNEYGFYHLINLQFDSVYALKPIATKNENLTLNWLSGNDMNEAYIDTWMIKYLEDNYGLTHYEIKRRLVSKECIDGNLLFNHINKIYDLKQLQDNYKDSKSPLYNVSLRETYKLFMNSLSGKLVEDPSKYFKVEWTTNTNNKQLINGVGIDKQMELGINSWITSGVMVYSKSKIILFDYIHCLPNKSDDIVHIETDGMYFPYKYHDEYLLNIQQRIDNDIKCPEYFKVGSALGNMEKDKVSDGISYWLGKKCYTYNSKNKSTFALKGMPLKTIQPDGSSKTLIDTSFFEGLYEGIPQKREYLTMKKSLFNNTYIASFYTSRTINPLTKYEEYN